MLWPTRYRSVGSDLIVLDALHAGDDDEVHDWSLSILLTDLMLRLLDKAAHRLTDFAARFRLQLLHGLFNPLDLNLGLFDVSLNAFAECVCACHFQGFLHAAQSLFFVLAARLRP